MTIYTRDQIDEMLEDLQAILAVRIRFNCTYQSVSANIDLSEDSKNDVVKIRWYDHIDEDQRKMGSERVTILPVSSLMEEVDHQKEELFEDLSEEDIRVLTEILLDFEPTSK